MTKLLKKAFDDASKLPEIEQNTLAKLLLHEIASEKKWEKYFADSEDLLSDLADEALQEN